MKMKKLMVSLLVCVMTLSNLTAGVYANTNLNENMIAHYNFDADLKNQVNQSSYNAEIVGSVSRTDTGGIDGGALSFNKQANSYLKIGSVFNASTQDFTLSAWVKYETGNSDGTNKVSLFQQNGDGRTVLYTNPSYNYGTYLTANDALCNKAVTVDEWHHVAITWNHSSKVMGFYINGEHVNNATLSGNPANAVTDLLIGGHKNGNASNAMKGMVDEVRIYNAVVSGDVIKGVYELNGQRTDLVQLQALVNNASSLSGGSVSATLNLNSAIENAQVVLNKTNPTAQEVKDVALQLQSAMDAYLESVVITINVNTKEVVRELSESMFGINHRYHNDGYGTWDSENDEINKYFDDYAQEASFGSVRYPGGTVSNLFEWKKTIGEDRKMTINGSTFFSDAGADPIEPNFGVDEAMTWIIDELDSEAIYVYGTGKGSAKDAADLIEYLNAPADGNKTNPNGGTDWAEIRKENGHEAPYNVTMFEIGNEVGQWGQTYWLDGRGNRSLPDAFINGGTMTFPSSTRVVEEEDWRSSASYSNGKPNQVKYTTYAPLTKGTVNITVGSTPYTIVDSLEGQGQSNVCVVDYETGKITFGDGINGNIPANGQQIKCGYSTNQDGFVAIYNAMKDTAKQIGIDINVLSGIDHSQADAFINLMNNQGMNNLYDGMSIHPYSGSFADANDALFYEKALARTLSQNVPNVEHLYNKMKYVTGEEKIVGVSEFGIFRYTNAFIKSLGHAIYIANEMIYYVDSGATYLDKHCLSDFVSGDGAGADALGPVGQCVIQSVLQEDGSYKYVSTPSARMFSIFNNMTGTTKVTHTIEGNGTFYTEGQHNVPQINVLTTTDEKGNTYITVVNNKHESSDVVINIDDLNLNGKIVEVWQMGHEDVNAENSLDNPDLVEVQRSTYENKESALSYTLLPTSVTSFKVNSYNDEVDYSALADKVEKIEQDDSSEYTTQSWNEFVKVLNTAKAVINKGTQIEVNNALIELNKAYALLVKKSLLSKIEILDPLSMSVTSPNYQPNNDSEGNPEFVLDGNPSTIWHTQWSDTPRDTHYLEFVLDEVTTLNSVRILQRSGTNGRIKSFDLYVKENVSDEWTKVINQEVLDSSTNWQSVSFEETAAKYIKLHVTDAESTTTAKYGAAAEVRFTKPTIIDEPVPPVVEPAKNGWEKVDGKWYFYVEDVAQTGWVKDAGKWYFMDESGVMQTGWVKDNNKWYYLNTHMMTGWQQIDGKWYYLNSHMITGWVQDAGKWYYLNSSMQTGWQKIDGKWYFLDSEMKTGWILDGGKWYYMNSHMMSGWQQVNGTWYYLNNAMVTGWLKINNTWYYFNSKGAMVTGTVTIDGKVQKFNSNGAWLG